MILLVDDTILYNKSSSFLLFLKRRDRRKQVYMGIKTRKHLIPCPNLTPKWKILGNNMHVLSN